MGSMSEERLQQIIVADDASPSRLDRFLCGAVDKLSRRLVRALVQDGRVRVNGRLPRKSQLVGVGDKVTIDWPSRSSEAKSYSGPEIPILYQDQWLVAVDKPAGVHSLNLGDDEGLSVATFLAHRFPECRNVSIDPRESGLVHRLDRETSGILIAARDRGTHRRMRELFSDRRVTKKYLALVVGDLRNAGSIELAIGHLRRHRHKMSIARPGVALRSPRSATTNYKPIEEFASHTLLEVMMETGVRHQIRVHLSSIGHPIVGRPAIL